MTNFAEKLNFIYRTFRGVRRDRESFELLFSRFRQVLDDNNKALEIITDMGDTLGGDYLFDIQYVRRSYADLRAAVSDAIRDFDLLTHGRYPCWATGSRALTRGSGMSSMKPSSPQDLIVFMSRFRRDGSGHRRQERQPSGDQKRVEGTCLIRLQSRPGLDAFRA
jgi:hypothetical protein